MISRKQPPTLKEKNKIRQHTGRFYKKVTGTCLVAILVAVLVSSAAPPFMHPALADCAGIIIGFLTAVILSRRLCRPVETLEIMAHRAAGGDLSSLAPIFSGDEVENLSRSLCRITEALETSLQREASTNKELMETARQAGMAEVTVGVLHNVGNVLNSVGVTTNTLRNKIKHSRVPSLGLTAALINEHIQSLEHFLTQDDRGRNLPEYIQALSTHLTKERDACLQDLDELDHHLNHTRDIINLQQTYSRSIGLTEAVRLKDLVGDALQLNKNSLMMHQIRVVKQFNAIPSCLLDRHKVLQILANLISNAKDALVAGGKKEKVLTVSIEKQQDDRVCVTVSDNGIGITRKNLRRIFSYGFTTRKDGHGFGLHHGALAAREMHGMLSVESDGESSGATFTLELPFRSKESAHDAPEPGNTQNSGSR